MNPRQVAIETAARYDTNNPFEIARERNIRILHQPLKTTPACILPPVHPLSLPAI